MIHHSADDFCSPQDARKDRALVVLSKIITAAATGVPPFLFIDTLHSPADNSKEIKLRQCKMSDDPFKPNDDPDWIEKLREDMNPLYVLQKSVYALATQVQAVFDKLVEV